MVVVHLGHQLITQKIPRNAGFLMVVPHNISVRQRRMVAIALSIVLNWYTNKAKAISAELLE